MRTLFLSVLFAGLSAVLTSGTAHAQACGSIGTETRLQVVLLTAETPQRAFCYIERTIFARSMGPIVGLAMGETLVGIDFRPSNGLLYGLGSLGGVYVLAENAAMMQVTAIRTATLLDAVTNTPVTLTGTSFGVDFNPVPDRLRVVSDTGQNLRINVVGAMMNTNVDAVLSPAMGFTGAAYTNNDGDAGTATVLYTINSMTPAPATSDQLNIQSPPNNGNQVPVGVTGFDTGPVVGFDIFTVLQGGVALRNRGIALLSSTSMGTTSMNLFQINLETGAATQLPIPGSAGFALPVIGVAIPLVQSGTVVF